VHSLHHLDAGNDCRHIPVDDMVADTMEHAMTAIAPLGADVLPRGVRARFVDGINGLSVHLLEAGYEHNGRPCVLLLHGFPELAYSWRRVMLPLADAGYHVVAPDLRGYGRTTGWDSDYDGDLASFRMLNIVRDVLGLVYALGYRRVAAVVGHDYGSPVAAWCTMLRPDVFTAMVLMSAPFAGAPSIPFDIAAHDTVATPAAPSIHDALAALPQPRKHYHWYYSTRRANADLLHCRQGVHHFLRAYYHHKSADWPHNMPHKLASWTAPELAKMPTYYIMPLDKDMAETVAPHMPSPEEVAACRWLPDHELAVYAAEYARTGFQGGLNGYRVRTSGRFNLEFEVCAGKTIDVPSMFISGRSDWGTYQAPGAFERMQESVCTRMNACHLVDGAGHWVQQEQPEAVVALLLEFLGRTEGANA
jgi:pimeloyl-ACP methyl ester carboxylesterase